MLHHVQLQLITRRTRRWGRAVSGQHSLATDTRRSSRHFFPPKYIYIFFSINTFYQHVRSHQASNSKIVEFFQMWALFAHFWGPTAPPISLILLLGALPKHLPSLNHETNFICFDFFLCLLQGCTKGLTAGHKVHV